MPKKGMSMLYGGLDIGSVATKALLWDGERVLARRLRPSGWDPRRAGEQCLAEALGEAGRTPGDLSGLTVTGYGRTMWPGKGQTVTEVTCLLHGIRRLAPGVRTVLDIGGQDSKVLALDAEGALEDFVINDRCAAGTGRFLELAGQRLGLTAAELGELATDAEEGVRLSSVCAVFAESEVVGLLAQGVQRGTVARGLCEAVAHQVLSLAGRLPREAPLALVGGVAYNVGVRLALERALAERITVPDEPQMVVAFGAALLASEHS
jgi:(R)-2-hydroxyacyl-CoA dehydratese activating ATPase